MKRFLFIAGCIGALAAGAAPRDPFWPIGFEPGSRNIPDTTEPKTTVTAPVARPLTDEELRAMALEESEKIRQDLRLKRKATAIFNNRVHAYMQDRWFTVGDNLMVDSGGRRYSLKILKLTPDNIELEAPREVVPNQP